MTNENNTSNVEIIPIIETHFHSLWLALDIVAREKQYLAFLQAPPQKDAFSFFQNIVNNDLCQFIALHDDTVIGWCDILPAYGEARAHVGVLGIGLIPGFRHLGIGAKLIETALSSAWEKGFSRIELSVRKDNANAKALYERFGFAIEGINRNGYFVDGEFYDVCTMALLAEVNTAKQKSC